VRSADCHPPRLPRHDLRLVCTVKDG
jgi:hypothetical protein